MRVAKNKRGKERKIEEKIKNLSLNSVIFRPQFYPLSCMKQKFRECVIFNIIFHHIFHGKLDERLRFFSFSPFPNTFQDLNHSRCHNIITRSGRPDISF